MFVGGEETTAVSPRESQLDPALVAVEGLVGTTLNPSFSV